MPKKETKIVTKKSLASAPSVSESAKEAKSPAVEAKPVAPPPPKARPVLVSFARWFAARSKEKGWKPHWVSGMKAYANTAGRLPMEGWDDLFKAY